MEKTIIRLKKKIKMKNPILVEGLPGIGLSGKIAADYLIKDKRVKKIGNIYSPYFPPQVLMRKNGIARMLGMRLYHMSLPKNDLLILVGDVQASDAKAHFEITDKILDFFQKNGGKFVITLGGYGTGQRPTGEPKVFGAATHQEVIDKYSAKGIEFGRTKGSIVGAAGLLLGLGKLRKMQGLCLMAETHGGYIDPKAALVLLKKLAQVLEMEVETDKLEHKVAEGEKFIKKMEEKAAKEAGEETGVSSTGRQDLGYIR
ncbi:MAG: proteasome assembly chaperone family protein [Candidatus Micrarchaeia archaeon]